jgi:hypothetical protein
MGFMFGKSSVEPSLKLHLLLLEMQPLYQDVKICDLALSTERRTMSKLMIYCNYSILFQWFIVLVAVAGRVAVLNRKVSNVHCRPRFSYQLWRVLYILHEWHMDSDQFPDLNENENLDYKKLHKQLSNSYHRSDRGHSKCPDLFLTLLARGGHLFF